MRPRTKVASVILLALLASESRADFLSSFDVLSNGQRTFVDLPIGTYTFSVISGAWSNHNGEYDPGRGLGWATSWAVSGFNLSQDFFLGKFPTPGQAFAATAPRTFSVVGAGPTSFYVRDDPYDDNTGSTVLGLYQADISGFNDLGSKKILIRSNVEYQNALAPQINLNAAQLLAGDFELTRGTVSLTDSRLVVDNMRLTSQVSVSPVRINGSNSTMSGLGDFTIFGPGASVTFAAGSRIGFRSLNANVTGSGSFFLDGSELNLDNHLALIGGEASFNMKLTNASHLNFARSSSELLPMILIGGNTGYVGGPTGTGSLLVTSGSVLEGGSATYLGLGAGSLTAEGGSRVTVGNMSINAFPGATATATIRTGSTLQLVAERPGLRIGDSIGEGTLTLESDSTVDLGSNGTISIEFGSFQAKSNSDIYAAAFNVGDNPQRTGTAELADARLTFLGAANRLQVGNNGTGEMTVHAGANVDGMKNTGGCGQSGCLSFVSNAAGSQGTLNIEQGGTVRLTNLFTVANSAVFSNFGVAGATSRGTVNILGGSLTSGVTVVGRGGSGPLATGQEKGFGKVMVDGASGIWNIVRTEAGQAFLQLGQGFGGDGRVEVVNGGSIAIDGRGAVNPGINLGGSSSRPGGLGELIVRGSPSKVSIAGSTGSIVVGRNGQDRAASASLSVLDGGRIFGEGDNGLAFVTVGRQGATGLLTVDGGPEGTRSTLTIAGIGGEGSGSLGVGARLIVGTAGGVGAVIVSGGGQINIDALTKTTNGPSGLFVGSGSGSVGSLVITGHDSAITLRSLSPNQVSVGGTSVGTVTVEKGGTLSVQSSHETSIPYSQLTTRPLTVGSLGTSGSSFKLDAESYLNFGGVGDFVNVYSGTANIHGKVTANLLDSAISLPKTTNGSRLSGIANLNGNFEISSGASIVPGQFIPLVRAHDIDIGARDISIVGSQVRLGDASFTTTVNANSSRGLSLQPERLLVNCGIGSGDGLCDSVLGVRGIVRANAFVGTSAPSSFLGSVANAERMARSTEIGVLSSLSNLVYADGTPSAGSTVLSSIELDGLKAVAYQGSATNAPIVIAVRGTEGGLLDPNWHSNYGLAVAPTLSLRSYVSNLSSFVGSVFAANAGSNEQFVFTGHSLGGAMAQIVANYFGAPAYTFNAPPIGNVKGTFSTETLSIASLGRQLDLSNAGLINFRLSSDPVSELPFSKVGQTVTLLGDPLLYLAQKGAVYESPFLRTAMGGILASLPGLATGKPFLLMQEHSMDKVDQALQNANDHPVIWIEDHGVVVDNREDIGLESALRQVLQQILVPTDNNSDAVSHTFSSAVRSHLTYFLDPTLSYGYEFQSLLNGPRFAGFLLPNIGVVPQTYKIESFYEGMWHHEGESVSDSYFALSLPSSDVRLMLLGEPTSEALDSVYFGVTFDSNGDFNGRLFALDINGQPMAAVPEPSTYALLTMGFAVIFICIQRRSRAFASSSRSCGAWATRSAGSARTVPT